jgi:hypothetical protein
MMGLVLEVFWQDQHRVYIIWRETRPKERTKEIISMVAE